MQERHRSTWKGQRRQINSKVPQELYDAVKARAAQRGCSMGDVMLSALARDFQRPDLDPHQDRDDQPEQMAMTA